MRNHVVLSTLACLAVALGAGASQSSRQSAPVARSVIEQEASVAVRQPGPHGGGGVTTAYPFFATLPDFKLVFRKRVLHQKSAIGYHVQEFDEVYYIISGAGEYTLNGVRHPVGPGTAMLTRPGDSHGLRPIGDEDLVLIVAYQAPGR